MTIFERLSFTNLIKQAKNLIVEEPVLDGVWIDLNYITTCKLTAPKFLLMHFFLFFFFSSLS